MTVQANQNYGAPPLTSYFTLRSTVVGALCGLLFSLGRKHFSGEPVLAPLLLSGAFLALSLNEGFWRLLVKQKIVSEAVLGKSKIPSSPHVGKPRIATNYTSCESLVGKAVSAATEQAGSRFLQKAVFEKDPTFPLVFPELVKSISELAVDQFGNYLVQSMLEHCPRDQRSLIVQHLCPNIFKFSCSSYGVRCIQMMIDTCKNDKEAVQSICHALHGHVCSLTRDLYGNHVIQRCLRVFPHADTEFISIAIADDLVGACCHPYGCCVIQLILERCDESELQLFVNKLQKDTVRLAQCPYGNYVVQLLVGLKNPQCTHKIVSAMKGHIGVLSSHKFSSNVIEKCLQTGDGEIKAAMIDELLEYSGFERLLQDPFGNYVVQKAMSCCDSESLHKVMEAIRPYVDSLRAAPYGRRIYNKYYKHERIFATALATEQAAKDMSDL